MEITSLRWEAINMIISCCFFSSYTCLSSVFTFPTRQLNVLTRPMRRIFLLLDDRRNTGIRLWCGAVRFQHCSARWACTPGPLLHTRPFVLSIWPPAPKQQCFFTRNYQGDLCPLITAQQKLKVIQGRAASPR